MALLSYTHQNSRYMHTYLHKKLCLICLIFFENWFKNNNKHPILRYVCLFAQEKKIWKDIYQNVNNHYLWKMGIWISSLYLLSFFFIPFHIIWFFFNQGHVYFYHQIITNNKTIYLYYFKRMNKMEKEDKNSLHINRLRGSRVMCLKELLF